MVNKIVIVVVIAVVAFIVLAGIIGGGSKSNQGDKVTEITQSQAEKVCQDAAFIRKYTPESVSLISITKYTPVLMDYDDTTKNFSWSGKNNDTGDTVRFSCNVKVIDGKVTPISLAIDGESVYTRD